MGKNFSCNNVDKKRRVADSYATPYSLTRLFLDTGALLKEAPTLEPACGDGAITKVLAEYGFKDVKAFDLEQGQDFLTYNEPVSQLITNPPYSLAYEFIQHSKEIVKNRFALLLPCPICMASAASTISGRTGDLIAFRVCVHSLSDAW